MKQAKAGNEKMANTNTTDDPEEAAKNIRAYSRRKSFTDDFYQHEKFSAYMDYGKGKYGHPPDPRHISVWL